ncbi:MAG: MIP/aquaporin family protein [Candidatus Bathyarchaeia archaeon]
MSSIPCAKCKKECSAEFLGTYMLVLFGAGSVIVSTFIKGFASLVFVASIFGGTVALVILLLGKHSGAHINPAVTLAHAFAGKASRDMILPYLCFQAVGGIVAAFTLRLFFLNHSVMPADLGSTELAYGVTPLYGILLEAIGTFLLCSAALAATFYVRQPIRQAGLVGGTLFLLILLIGHLTGASFNPARSIGPALSSGHWSNILVYLIGPLLGALVAAIPFRISHQETTLELPLCPC